jgi:5-methylcytosine-specific restriction protein A
MTKITKPRGRPVKEWSSDDPSAMPPPRVRLRILRRFNGKCALTGIIIADGQRFDLDHIVRVEDGGANCESNLQPVLRLPHEVKSLAEKKRQDKADRQAKAAHGLTAPRKKIEGRGFTPTEPRELPKGQKAKIEKGALPALGPGNLARRFSDV